MNFIASITQNIHSVLMWNTQQRVAIDFQQAHTNLKAHNNKQIHEVTNFENKTIF